jgi:hypothetical protein
MSTRIRRSLWKVTLSLAALATTPGLALASSIPFGSIGSVGTPTGGTSNLVYYNGNSGTLTPPQNVDLGQFVVSPLAATTPQTYTNDPFNVIAYSGNNGAEITGVLNGTTGPNSSPLTATITNIQTFGQGALPFTLNLPLNTPLSIAQSSGASAAATTLSVAVTAPTPIPAPAPEPSSVAIFAVAIGGLGLWSRRFRRAG